MLAELRFDLDGELRILLQELFGLFAALSDPEVSVGQPGSGLFDDLGLHPHVEKLALPGNALSIVDVELRLTEGSGDLVLDDLDLGAGSHDRLAVLQRGDAADVDADGGIELQRASAG